MNHDYLYITHKALLKDNKRAYKIIRYDTDIAETIELYKGSLSYEVNAFLREEKRRYNVSHAMLIDMVRKLSRVVQASSLSSPVILYRVVFGEYAAMLCSLKRHTRFDSGGFASWTFDVNQAFNFDLDDPHITLLRTTLPKGASFLYIDGMNNSKTLYQSEVLTDKHATFEIQKKSNISFFPDLHRMQKNADFGNPFNKKKRSICLIDIAYTRV